MSEEVNHPEYYTADGLEAIDVIESFDLNFHLGNVIKYVLRAGRKCCAMKDLQKAKWYLDRQVELSEEAAARSTAVVKSARWMMNEDDFFKHSDQSMRCVMLRRQKLELERKIKQIEMVMDDVGCER